MYRCVAIARAGSPTARRRSRRRASVKSRVGSAYTFLTTITLVSANKVRRVILLVYALVFVTELSQAAIVPLLPTFGRELSLSDVETGAILAATTFATVIVSIPIGLRADRVGAHRLTVAAALVITAAALVQAFASSFGALLAGRALFGLGFATVWTAGVSLIGTASSGRRAGAIGGTIAVGGAAHFVGPLGAGFLGEHVSLSTPFFLIAGAAAVVAVLLASARAPAPASPPREPLRAALKAARRHHEIKTALVVMALLGVIAGLVPLLVPLLLDENGLSPGQIGAVFSAGAAVWILASTTAARNASRAVRTLSAGIGALALGAVLVVPALTVATVGIAVFVLLRAAAHAPLSTISYPLADAAARLYGIGSATVIALANVVWATAAATSPVLAGALAESVGARGTFAMVALGSALAGAWIIVATRRERARVEAFDTA
jgi:predicted MFS family arabinose efflux permease